MQDEDDALSREIARDRALQVRAIGVVFRIDQSPRPLAIVARALAPGERDEGLVQPPVDRDDAIGSDFMQARAERRDGGIEERLEITIVPPDIGVAQVHRHVPRE